MFDPAFAYDQAVIPGYVAIPAGGAITFDPSYALDQPYAPAASVTATGTVGTVTFDPSFSFDQPFTPATTTTVTTTGSVPLGTAIQGFINLGNAFTAQFIGTPYQQYRCTTIGPVLQPANLITTFNAAFAQKGNFKLMPSVKVDEWQGYFNGAVTQAGDYLTNGALTYFVACQLPLLPYVCIICPRVVSIARPASVTAVGVSNYGGSTAATQTALMTGWPASILQGTKGEKGDVTVPDDVKSPWYTLRLPLLAGTTIESGDIVSDDLGRLYTISSAELTAFGWRFTMRLNQN